MPNQHVKPVIRIGKKQFFSTQRAVSFVGASRATLGNWEVSCPWLNGEGIVAFRETTACGRPVKYYAKDDLIRVREAGRLALVPDHPGYVYIADAMNEIGISAMTLHRLMKAKQVRAKDFLGKSKDGRPLPRSYVPRDFVDGCLKARHQIPPGELMTVREASAILDISIPGVRSLIHLGILKVHGKINSKSGYKRNLLSRLEVEARRDEVFTRVGPAAGRARRENAKAVLSELLADGMPQISTEVLRAEAARGITEKLVYEARKKLKVQRTRPVITGPAYWRLPATKLREQRTPTAPANKGKPTPSDRAEPGRIISDRNKKIYRTCNEMHARAKAGEFKMRVAVAKVLEACGDDALGRKATLNAQKARMRLNVKTFQNSKQFEGERN